MRVIGYIPRIVECDMDDISVINDEIGMEAVEAKSYLDGFEQPRLMCIRVEVTVLLERIFIPQDYDL